MRKKVFFPILPLTFVGVLLTGCGIPSPSAQQHDVANLPKVFSQLETLKVEDYRNQDWCKNVAYRRGKFSNNLESGTCNLFNGTPKPMDAQAQQDFQAIARLMATTGVNIHFLSAQYNSSNRLTEVEFHLATFCRCSYVYSPRYKLPEDMGDEMKFTAINSSWYFVWEDWN
jgi:hypothetical protein